MALIDGGILASSEPILPLLGLLLGCQLGRLLGGLRVP